VLNQAQVNYGELEKFEKVGKEEERKREEGRKTAEGRRKEEERRIPCSFHFHSHP
jgi:hypothetical protein